MALVVLNPWVEIPLGPKEPLTGATLDHRKYQTSIVPFDNSSKTTANEPSMMQVSGWGWRGRRSPHELYQRVTASGRSRATAL